MTEQNDQRTRLRVLELATQLVTSTLPTDELRENVDLAVDIVEDVAGRLLNWLDGPSTHLTGETSEVR